MGLPADKKSRLVILVQVGFHFKYVFFFKLYISFLYVGRLSIRVVNRGHIRRIRVRIRMSATTICRRKNQLPASGS